MNGEVDDCGLGDRAGGGFDGNCRCPGRGGWDEDIAVTGTACEEAGGEEEGYEQTEETAVALLAE